MAMHYHFGFSPVNFSDYDSLQKFTESIIKSLLVGPIEIRDFKLPRAINSRISIGSTQ